MTFSYYTKCDLHGIMHLDVVGNIFEHICNEFYLKKLNRTNSIGYMYRALRVLKNRKG